MFRFFVSPNVWILNITLISMLLFVYIPSIVYASTDSTSSATFFTATTAYHQLISIETDLFVNNVIQLTQKRKINHFRNTDKQQQQQQQQQQQEDYKYDEHVGNNHVSDEHVGDDGREYSTSDACSVRISQRMKFHFSSATNNVRIPILTEDVFDSFSPFDISAHSPQVLINQQGIHSILKPSPESSSVIEIRFQDYVTDDIDLFLNFTIFGFLHTSSQAHENQIRWSVQSDEILSNIIFRIHFPSDFITNVDNIWTLPENMVKVKNHQLVEYNSNNVPVVKNKLITTVTSFPTKIEHCQVYPVRVALLNIFEWVQVSLGFSILACLCSCCFCISLTFTIAYRKDDFEIKQRLLTRGKKKNRKPHNRTDLINISYHQTTKATTSEDESPGDGFESQDEMNEIILHQDRRKKRENIRSRKGRSSRKLSNQSKNLPIQSIVDEIIPQATPNSAIMDPKSQSKSYGTDN